MIKKITSLSILFIALISINAQTVINYPAPAAQTSFYSKSTMYQVAVNSQDVFVYDFDPSDTLAKIPGSMDPKPAHWDPGVFAYFDFTGTISVVVTFNETVTTAVIRPKSLSITPVINGKTVTLSLSSACNFGVEINGKKESPLFVFANPILPKPDKLDPNVVFIAGDSIYENYSLPANATGKTIYVEGGAILRCNSGFAANNLDLTNTKIMGSGIITGVTATKDQHIFGWTKPSSNFEMNGPIFISTHKGGAWAVVPYIMENATLTNVKMFGFNRDALDILSCRNFTIDKCFLWSYDDACVIKASVWAEPALVDGITIKNSTIWNHGLMIGFETRTPYIENITFKNIDIVNFFGNTGNPINRFGSTGLRNPVIGINIGDEAKVSNIRYDDIRVENPWTDDFFQFVTAKDYASTHAEKGRITGVYVKNLRVIEADSRLSGIYDSEIIGSDSSGNISKIFIEGLMWNGAAVSSLASSKIYVGNYATEILVKSMASRTTIPSSPSILSSVSIGGLTNHLYWNDNSDNEDGFIIERKEGAGAYAEIMRVVAGLNEYYDRRLKDNIQYSYRIKSYNDAGMSSYTNESVITCVGQSPFKVTPFNIPGTIKAEDFDLGGEGVSWHDGESGNSGGNSNSGGYYRAEVDPDIGIFASGYNIGWLSDGEWLEYTIDVANAGKYKIDVYTASNSTNGRFHIEFDGADKTGLIVVPNTTDWNLYKPTSVLDVSLNAGKQVMRFYIDKAGFNFYKFVIDASTEIKDNNIQNNEVFLYPNPASQKINVEINIPSEIIIRDLNSREMLYSANSISHVIDVSQLNNGVYFVEIKNENEIVVKKIIISH